MSEEKTIKTRAEIIEILGDAFIGRGQWEEDAPSSIFGIIDSQRADVLFGPEAGTGVFEEYTAQWKLRASQIAALACYDTVHSDLIIMMRQTFESTLVGKRVARPVRARISFDLVDKEWDIRLAMLVSKVMN